MLLYCGVGEDSWESLDCKEIQPVHPKGNQSWIFIGSIDADATLILWPPELKNCKRPWCWERLQAVREAGDRGWDGWMASLTQWTWVWVGSRNWWWTGRLGIVQLVHGVTKIWTQLSHWTDYVIKQMLSIYSSYINVMPIEKQVFIPPPSAHSPTSNILLCFHEFVLDASYN